ncbi:hypothetical protein BJ166DRAFT_584789 [Pestalotiopsis sp. NC0098]|nr:hypothetical protein BJ166DRAFT_584789 [Pestalotiopsis sp. NC0098]
MKLLIGGSSGFVGTELVRQALLDKDVSSVVGLSRRETPTPLVGDASKFTSVVCDDFENYPDDIREHLRDVDACIWTIAVTPSKLNTVPRDQALKISCDYALTALETLASLRGQKEEEGGGPLSFILMTGHFTPRTEADVSQVLRDRGMADYGLARGASEVKTLALAQASDGAVEAAIAKPGLIMAPGVERRGVPGIPEVDLTEVAAAMLDQVLRGFESDTLSNDDLVRIGRRVLAEK